MKISLLIFFIIANLLLITLLNKFRIPNIKISEFKLNETQLWDVFTVSIDLTCNNSEAINIIKKIEEHNCNYKINKLKISKSPDNQTILHSEIIWNEYK